MFLKKVDCEKKRKRWFLRFLSGQGSPSIAITNRVQTISFVSWDPKRETCTHGRRLIELGCTRRGTKWRSSCKCLYNLQAINRIARCNNLYSHGRENTCDTATPFRGARRPISEPWCPPGTWTLLFVAGDKHRLVLPRGSGFETRRARRKEVVVNTEFIGSSITDIRSLIFLWNIALSFNRSLILSLRFSVIMIYASFLNNFLKPCRLNCRGSKLSSKRKSIHRFTNCSHESYSIPRTKQNYISLFSSRKPAKSPRNRRRIVSNKSSPKNIFLPWSSSITSSLEPSSRKNSN